MSNGTTFFGKKKAVTKLIPPVIITPYYTDGLSTEVQSNNEDFERPGESPESQFQKIH
jgi:hypothetical protein